VARWHGLRRAVVRLSATVSLCALLAACGGHRDARPSQGLPLSIATVRAVFAAHGVPIRKNGGSDRNRALRHGPRDPLATFNPDERFRSSLQWLIVYPSPLQWPPHLPPCHGPELQRNCSFENLAVANVQIVFLPSGPGANRVMGAIRDLRRRVGISPSG
jgi:hypothetical protein